MHICGERTPCVYEDRMSVRLGAGQEFRRQISIRPGPVFDNDDAADLGPHSFCEESYDRIGAAARRIGANEMQVLSRVVLRRRAAARQASRQNWHQAPEWDHVVVPSLRHGFPCSSILSTQES